MSSDARIRQILAGVDLSMTMEAIRQRREVYGQYCRHIRDPALKQKVHTAWFICNCMLQGPARNGPPGCNY